MSSLTMQNLKDVKEKLKYEKNAYCLLSDKRRVNDIIKNIYSKPFLIDIHKFPSVLNFKEHKQSILKDDKNILAFIHDYVENLDKSNKIEEKCDNDKSNENLNNIDGNILAAIEENLKLIPLNDNFIKMIREITKNEKFAKFENTNKQVAEKPFIENKSNSKSNEMNNCKNGINEAPKGISSSDVSSNSSVEHNFYDAYNNNVYKMHINDNDFNNLEHDIDNLSVEKKN